MTVIEHINAAAGTLFSFEILPPKKGDGIEQLFETVEALLPYHPAFIDVTSHATEVIYQDAGDGLVRRIPVQKRPGTLSVCAAIKYRYGVDTVPHLICSGFTKEETEDALVELSFLGLNNVMALRGDPSLGEKRFQATPGGHCYAVELVQQIKAMNEGRYLHEQTDGMNPTKFCIGVAGYPEKHCESPNPASDIRFLKEKIDQGADFVVTQMFFDNEKYLRYVDACRKAGINAPIIPGLKPISVKRHLSLLPQAFFVDLPDKLASAIEKAGTRDEVRKIGTEWAIQQCEELVREGAPCLHFYTMGRADSVKEIVDAIFG